MLKTSPCRSCQAPISFVSSKKNNRPIPVDPEYLTVYIVQEKPANDPFPKRVTLVTDDGEILAGWYGSIVNPGAQKAEGYISHFATCDDPARFRTMPKR